MFTDGTVNNNDGNPLVDDLFYYSQTTTSGPRTSTPTRIIIERLARGARSECVLLDADLSRRLSRRAAAGVDPLVHFDQTGWREGAFPRSRSTPRSISPPIRTWRRRNRSARALPRLRRAAKAASRSRLTLLAANGFDYVYYLQQQSRRRGGRRRSVLALPDRRLERRPQSERLFDTTGYLATYTDVAAAGINPLDQYHAAAGKRARSVGRLRHRRVSRPLPGCRGRADRSAGALSPVRCARRPQWICGRCVGNGGAQQRRFTALDRAIVPSRPARYNARKHHRETPMSATYNAAVDMVDRNVAEGRAARSPSSIRRGASPTASWPTRRARRPDAGAARAAARRPRRDDHARHGRFPGAVLGRDPRRHHSDPAQHAAAGRAVPLHLQDSRAKALFVSAPLLEDRAARSRPGSPR